MARPKKAVEAAGAPAALYTVTAGNIVYDADGVKRVAGDSVTVPGEAAEGLKAAGIIE